MFDVKGEPSHCGMWVEAGLMLHIRIGAGSLLERYDGPTWAPRFLNFYVHPDRA